MLATRSQRHVSTTKYAYANFSSGLANSPVDGELFTVICELELSVQDGGFIWMNLGHDRHENGRSGRWWTRNE